MPKGDYDNPYDDLDYKESGPLDQLQPIIDPIMENKTIVIGVLVLLIAGFFAYDFFIGGVKTVTIEAVDTEGEPINAAIKISNTNGDEIDKLASGTPVQLRKGDYLVDITASGYETLRSAPITVGENNKIEKILAKDLDVALQGVFPTSFATGEEKEIEITIINRESSQETIELLLEGDAEKLQLQYTQPLTVFPGENRVKVTLIAPQESEEEEQKGELKIAGLRGKDAKIEATFTINAFDKQDITVKAGNSRSNVDFRKIKVGEVQDKEISVKNENDFELRDVKISVENITTEATDSQDVKNWFELNPTDTLYIAAGEEQTTNLILRVPIDHTFESGREEEQIQGRLVVKNDLFEITMPLSFTIEKIDAGVELRGMRDNYTLRYDEDDGYRDETGILEVRNSGDALLRDLRVIAQCDFAGDFPIKLNGAGNESTFNQLEKDETKDIPYLISVPDSTGSQTINCRLGVTYRIPSNERRESEQIVLITTEK